MMKSQRHELVHLKTDSEVANNNPLQIGENQKFKSLLTEVTHEPHSNKL